MATTELVCVPPANVAHIWPAVSPLIGEAFARCHGDDPPDSIRADVLEGRALLWLVTEHDRISVALITKVFANHKGRICQIVALAGEGLSRWVSLLPQLEQYAREMNCDLFRVSGRKGWKRVLPPAYVEPYVVLERTL